MNSDHHKHENLSQESNEFTGLFVDDDFSLPDPMLVRFRPEPLCIRPSSDSWVLAAIEIDDENETTI